MKQKLAPFFMNLDLQIDVAAIAAELGFRSAGYFTNFFCQKTGLSPSCYRKEDRLR